MFKTSYVNVCSGVRSALLCVCEAVKGLKAEPPGVLFHHFLEMTTRGRWRIFGIVGEKQSVRQQQRKHQRIAIIFIYYTLFTSLIWFY